MKQILAKIIEAIFKTLVLMIGVMIMFFMILLIMAPLRYVACLEYNKVTGRPTEYHFVTGCYVQVGHLRIPKDNFRYQEENLL